MSTEELLDRQTLRTQHWLNMHGLTTTLRIGLEHKSVLWIGPDREASGRNTA